MPERLQIAAGAIIALFLYTVFFFAFHPARAVADDQPPTTFRRADAYTRVGIPQRPGKFSITGDSTGDSATALITRDGTTVCWRHYSRVKVRCSAVALILFSESQALTEVNTTEGNGWGSDLDDPEGNADTGDLVGPASGHTDHGFECPASGWNEIIVPGALNESQVGYRGGYCTGGTGPGWPCDDDADCPSSGTCNNNAQAQSRKRCMFMHGAAQATSVVTFETFR